MTDGKIDPGEYGPPLAIVDNDEPVDAQQRFAQLWFVDGSPDAFEGGDGLNWPVDLHLSRPVNYKLVAAPKDATIDADMGVFTWQTPKEPQTAKISIRVHDAGRPELVDEASFLVTTTAPKR